MSVPTASNPTIADAAAENGTVTNGKAIRPFHIDVPEEDLEDLRRRIETTRWPEKETVDDQSQGPRLAMMQALARYGPRSTTGASARRS
jgi:hypothetical protein